MAKPREMDAAEQELVRRLRVAREEASRIQQELAEYRQKRKEEAWERKWQITSEAVETRTTRDLAIIEAILDGETMLAVARRHGLHPGTVSSIYGYFERALQWPGRPWPYATYPAELVAKWVRANPDEAGRAKYWFERAFAEATTIEPDPSELMDAVEDD